MDSFALIGSALYNRLGTVQYTYPTTGTATTTGSLGVYDSEAPRQGTAFLSPPYIIFQHQAGVDEYSFDHHGESLDYVVKVVSDRLTRRQAYAIYDQVHNNLQDAPLTLGSADVLRVRRSSRLAYRDGDGFVHTGAIYRFDFWD